MLVLASSSPRRCELLTQAGFSFEVHPAHIPEDLYSGEDPIAYVTRLAREKAQAVFRELALCQGTTSVVPQRQEKEGGALALGAPSFSRPLRKGWESAIAAEAVTATSPLETVFAFSIISCALSS